MESQPQNPEFRNNPENFHPCMYSYYSNPNSGFIQVLVYKIFKKDLTRTSKDFPIVFKDFHFMLLL